MLALFLALASLAPRHVDQGQIRYGQILDEMTPIQQPVKIITPREELDAMTAQIETVCGVPGTQFRIDEATDGALHAEMSPTLTTQQIGCAATIADGWKVNVPQLKEYETVDVQNANQ